MITVLKAGLYTSVQDLGRFGYRTMGVPVSGSMDAHSAMLANSILGNEAKQAVLECTLLGPILQFQQDTEICITGAPFQPMLNDIGIAQEKPIPVQKNDVLSIGRATTGMRCYVAVAGGFHTEKVLGSRSFYSTITENSVLLKGDVLPIAKPLDIKRASTDVPYAPKILSNSTLKVFPGPEFPTLKTNVRELLFDTTFKISAQSNRMAYVLETEVDISAKEILTAPVQPGTVQLTPSGKLVVLMRDAQVTGGYGRVLQLTEESINILAQKRGGEAISFTSV